VDARGSDDSLRHEGVVDGQTSDERIVDAHSSDEGPRHECVVGAHSNHKGLRHEKVVGAQHRRGPQAREPRKLFREELPRSTSPEQFPESIAEE